MNFIDYLKSFLSNNNGKTPTQIVTTDLHKVKGESTKLEAALLDNNNNPIANAKVKFDLSGKATYEKTTGSDGIASLGINLITGWYTFNLSFDGDETHQASNKSVKVYVNPVIQAEDTTVTEKSGQQLRANLTDANGIALDGTAVEFKFHFDSGDKCYYAHTGTDGVAYIPINLMHGTYKVDIRSGETTVPITLTCTEKKRIQTYIQGTDVITTEGASKSFGYKLYYKEGSTIKNIVNKNLTITVNGKSTTVTTNKDGNGAYQLSSLKAGSYKLTTSFAGDDDYIRSSRTNTITVKAKSSTYNSVVWKRQPNDYTCGPTSLSMCSQILGSEKSIDAFANACNTSTGGTSPSDMFSGAKKLGFTLSYINMSYAGVKESIDAKHPVIYYHYTGGLSCLNWQGGYYHYAVIYEYGDNNVFYCADPSKGTGRCSASAIINASYSFISVRKS